MEVAEYSDPGEFRSAINRLVLSEEPRHSLFLGKTGILLDRPEILPVSRLWAVIHRGEPVLGALMTPPNNLVLTDARMPDESMPALARFIRQSGVQLPGAFGNVPSVAHFCDAWRRLRGVTPRLEVSLQAHALTEVSATVDPPGRPRPATSDDLDLLISWTTSFLAETDPSADASTLEPSISMRLDARPDQAGMWLWEHKGSPVAMSGYGGPTPNGIRIAPVYTPPDARRRGYATALVSGLSSWLLDQGRHFCFLYTDISNPSTNALYRRIGFHPVADAARYAFSSSLPDE